jgi:hypothetical protein
MPVFIDPSFNFIYKKSRYTMVVSPVVQRLSTFYPRIFILHQLFLRVRKLQNWHCTSIPSMLAMAKKCFMPGLKNKCIAIRLNKEKQIFIKNDKNKTRKHIMFPGC